MNIVYYKGHDYFDYMKYYNQNDINVFIGNKYADMKRSVYKSKYKHSVDIFTFYYCLVESYFESYGLYGEPFKSSPSQVPFIRGAVYMFDSIESYLTVKEEVFPHEVTHTIE